MNNNLSNPIFLLGGHDLEMLEIRKMLSAGGYSFCDENLRWDNALLSRYSERLNDANRFVGVELMTDINPPKNYVLIDHHNEDADKPSAIEQIAELLGIALSRDQQLVAANDKGYIPAMIAMNATPEEIADIRRRDRNAQGVTEEDEQLAEQSIEENLTIENGVTVVKSLTSKFSTITDRLYPCPQLLIYTNHELSYYGEGVSQLAQSFNNLVKEHKAYSGGGENGFFGINREGISALGDSQNAVQQILNLLADGKYII